MRTLPSRPLLLLVLAQAGVIAVLLWFLLLPRQPGAQGWTPSDLEHAVATGPGFVITREAYAAALRKKGYHTLQGAELATKGREVLDEIIGQELLAAEARRRGLDLRPAVREEVNRALSGAVVSSALDSITVNAILPAAVTARFNAESSKYSRPEQLRLAHLLFEARPADGEAGRAAAQKRAAASLEKAKSYTARSLHFGDLARELSDDEATKHRGGDLGMVAGDRVDLPATVVQAGFGLRALGEVSEIVESPRGFHIVRLTGRRPAFVRGFEEVETEIRSQLLAEARAERYRNLLADLNSSSGVSVREDRLDVSEWLRSSDPSIAMVPPSPPLAPSH